MIIEMEQFVKMSIADAYKPQVSFSAEIAQKMLDDLDAVRKDSLFQRGELTRYQTILSGLMMAARRVTEQVFERGGIGGEGTQERDDKLFQALRDAVTAADTVISWFPAAK